jgi:hypothetical protein
MFTNNDSLKLCHELHSWSLSSWRPRFDSRPVHVGFMVNKVVLGLIFVPARYVFSVQSFHHWFVLIHLCIVQTIQFFKLTGCQHASINMLYITDVTCIVTNS